MQKKESKFIINCNLNNETFVSKNTLNFKPNKTQIIIISN